MFGITKSFPCTYLIDIFDELIDVLEVLVCVFKLEVGSKRQHDVCGLVVYPLVQNSAEELLHTQLHIVVKESGVVLWDQIKGNKVESLTCDWSITSRLEINRFAYRFP